MRGFTSYINQQLGYKVTRPQYLIDIPEFNIKWATKREVILNGDLYRFRRGVIINFIDNGHNFPNSVSLTILNNNYEISTNILQKGLGHSINIYKTYGTKYDLVSDYIIELIGKIVSMTPSDNNVITLRAEVEFFNSGKKFPAIYFTKPYFNHLPQSNDSFKWGSRTVYVGEKEEG